MDNDEKTYGRRRVKKLRPAIETQKAETEPQSQSAQAEANAETPAATSAVQEEKSPHKEREAKRPSGRRERSSRGQERSSRPPRDSDKRRDRGDRQPRERSKPHPRTSTRVSVIIPAYDEKDNVEPLLRQFDQVIKDNPDIEVIYVNDGSSDGTGRVARQAMNRYRWLRVMDHNRNKGLTAALETGFAAARGSIFVFYPADLQYHPQDIPRMIAKIDRGSDLVTGWKQGKYSKRFVSSVYNKICRMLFGIKVHDLNSVKAFRKEILNDLPMRRDWHRYMVVLASENDVKIDEVKVTLYPRASGKSKFGSRRILPGVLDLFSVKFQISFMKSPLRFFGTWGFVTGIAGFIIGIVAVYLRYFTDHGSRTLLYLVILLILAGLGLFALGFLAEVMVGLRDEINALKRKNGIR